MAKNSATGATGAIQSTIRLSTLLTLTALLAACDGLRSVSPSPPPGITPSSVTYTLSGVVTEMTAVGPVPIEGVRVVDASGRGAATDEGGSYSISGLPASSRTISVARNGYLTGNTTVTMAG